MDRRKMIKEVLLNDPTFLNSCTVFDTLPLVLLESKYEIEMSLMGL